MAEILVQTDCDPYPAKAGTPLTNTGGRVFSDGSTIQDRNKYIRFKYRAGSNTNDPDPITRTSPVGVATNGPNIFSSAVNDTTLPISGITAPSGFHWNSVENAEEFPVDACGGRPETSGEYRYRTEDLLLMGLRIARLQILALIIQVQLLV